MNLLILDQDSETRKTVRLLLKNLYGEFISVSEAHNFESALNYLNDSQIDLTISAIILEDGLVFELLDQLEELTFQIIFLSSSELYGFTAIKYNPIDYILKPIQTEELTAALRKAEHRINDSKKTDRPVVNFLASRHSKKLEKLIIPSAEGLNFIMVKDILYLEGEGNYSTIYLKSGEILVTSRGLRDYELTLPTDQFFRIHQSYLINIDRISKVLREDGGFVVMEGDKKIHIARRRKEDFMTRVTKRFR